MKVIIVVRLANKMYSAFLKVLTIFYFVIFSASLGNAQIASSMSQVDCDSGLVERVFTNRYITEVQACILLNDQKSQLKTAKENLEMLVQENLSFREKTQELNEQLIDIKQKLLTSYDTSNAQVSELKACSSQRDRLYIENSQLVEEHQSLLSQHDAVLAKESESNNRNLLFEAEVNALKAQKSIHDTELNQKVFLLGRQLGNCQQKLTEKNTENQMFLSNINSLQKRVRALQKVDDDRAIFRSKNAELRKQNDNLSTENTRLSSTLTGMKTENETLKVRLSEVTVALEEERVIAGKIGRLTSQLVAKDMEIERLRNALKVAENADAVHMKEKAAQAMRKLVIDFQSTDKNIEATMSNDVLSVLVSDIFKSGSMKLSSDAGVFLDELAATMITLMDKNPNLPYRFAVVGHADKMPVSGSKFSSNWELSASRAAVIVKALIERGIDPSRVLVAGQAEFDPIDQSDTKEALKNNRRIEIHTY